MPPRTAQGKRGGAPVSFANDVRSPISVAASPLPSPSAPLPMSPTTAHGHTGSEPPAGVVAHHHHIYERDRPDVLAAAPVAARGGRRGSQPVRMASPSILIHPFTTMYIYIMFV
jgi:hypothetical protein